MTCKREHFVRAWFKLLFLLIITSLSAYANETYHSMCVTCHGKSAEGNSALNAPALAGLDTSYLQRQLQHFQSGVRGSHPEDSLGQQMASFAKALDHQKMSAVAQYLTKLPATERPITIQADINNGKKIFSSNCAACHGGQGEGNPVLNSPSLTLQSDIYLLRQLRNFKQGIRGSHAEDKYGRQMAMMARTLPDEQAMKDVIAYLNTLGSQ